jgi:tRNA nucleotidyltransferase (CCA-adding enzyme)
MRAMVEAGEVDALVPERVWQELSRGLMEQAPSRMFEVLRACGALARILPELDRLWGVPPPPPPLHHPEIDTGMHVMMVVDMAARLGCSLPVRFAAVMHDLGKGVTPPSEWPRHYGHEARSVELADAVCHRLKIPNDCRDLALMSAREHGNVGKALELRPGTIVKLMERCDAFRKPQRFMDMLQVAECDHRGRTGFENQPFPQKERLERALHAARGVEAGAIAGAARERYPDQPSHIPKAIHEARIAAVAASLKDATFF